LTGGGIIYDAILPGNAIASAIAMGRWDDSSMDFPAHACRLHAML
jgi:hypothetical protein